MGENAVILSEYAWLMISSVKFIISLCFFVVVFRGTLSVEHAVSGVEGNIGSCAASQSQGEDRNEAHSRQKSQ